MLVAVFSFSALACGEGRGSRLFRVLGAAETGIGFTNTITTNDSLNVQTDPYVYNGAGVAVGDIDNDGLPDIFFAGNMVSSRLYLNKGAMRFEDITRPAGVTTTRWATGVSMVDINNDGYLDIYVSVSGPKWSKGEARANLLFVNNGNRTFAERAAQYGIADTAFTTDAVFLDYDKDGCLDLFLLNNSPRDFSRGVIGDPSGLASATPGSYNELYRNNCSGGSSGKFTNVSRQAGILRGAGFGLGVAVGDLNRDGWPDIYVSNDVAPNDVVYVNNRDGTFSDKAAQWLKHTSFAGMGVDIADFNDDGWPDILQVDMLPKDLSTRKTMSGVTTYGSLLDARSKGFRDDYNANALQLSNGVRGNGEIIFSDIAHLAGVVATDWSWSPLFADLDNDGLKDIFITNGYPKAVIDLDYKGAVSIALRRGNAQQGRQLLAGLPGYEVPNYVFRNRGDLTFEDKSRQWGTEQPSYSYGAAYADLNNDGKLDIVVNNIDEAAFIYENVLPDDDAHHYLNVSLVGESPRRLTAGIGAEITLTAGGRKQHVYCSPYRGYMSTVDARAHFGIGNSRRVDSLEIRWPDGRYQLLTNLDVDRTLTVNQSNAVADAPNRLAASASRAEQWFQLLDLRGLEYEQPRSMQVDYTVQPLLPYLISRHASPLAVADVNGDSLDDVFVGGGADVAGQLFIQQRDGRFAPSSAGQPWEADKTYDDWGADFFDANGDGKPDLYVTSGGYQLAPSSRLLQDRLYINKGEGRFARDSAALPAMLTSTAAVRAADFNGDGRQDLFVGGRLSPRKYPYPPRSYILRNDGQTFTDVTGEVAPDLVQKGGMITDAAWIDFDGDGRVDLVTAGEWMGIEFYRNDGKRFHNVTGSTQLPPLRGWWYSLAVGDFDRDGRPDMIAGNLGLNYQYQTSKESKFGVYANNFTGNQTTDIVLTQMVGGKEYPLAGMAPLGREIYSTSVNFPTYGSFASASIAQLFSATALRQALHYEADTFASIYLHNDGSGKFTATPLPTMAQISPIKAIVTQDVDGDGNLDLIVAGNLYDAEPNTPRADAGNGLWLRGDGRGHFTPVSPRESGFLAPLNAAGLASINTRAGKAVVVANTGDSLQTFSIRKR